MTRWHPAAVLLVGMTASAVAGGWFYAYMNGNLRARDLLISVPFYWQTRLLLRLQKGTQ